MRKFIRTRSAPHPPAGPSSALAANGHATHDKTVGATADSDGSPADTFRWRAGKVQRDALWEDHEFPATWRALGDRSLGVGVAWLRPHEVCAQPTFLNQDFEESAAQRWSSARGGVLSDLHVLVAAAALAYTPRLLSRIAPPQSFTRHYTGAFRFRFWVFGSWRDVLVDDRLPARPARLLGAHPAPRDDLTLPLLEKAYAKLYGSYAALRAGSVARALQDLTGGVVQRFALTSQPSALTAQVLQAAVPRSTLLVAYVSPGKGGASHVLRNGLRSGCAYCVTGLARMRADTDVLLVRMRVAGSAAANWCGAWAVNSAEWRALLPPDRDLLAVQAHEPGYFWMCLDELHESFAALVLVHVGPDDWLAEPMLRDRRPWRAVLARRRWRRGYNAGGPPCAQTAGTNPQFHLHVTGAGKCHTLVALAQQYNVGAKRACTLHAVGFVVYSLAAAAASRRPAHDSLAGLHVLDETRPSRAREVVTLLALPPGQYLVVLHTRRPHTETSFLLRILTDQHVHVWEVNEDNVMVHQIGAELAGVAEQSASAPEGEVDAARLRRFTRAPGLQVCRALVALRDPELRGTVRPGDVPGLLALAARWRVVFQEHASCGSVSAYWVRALLRAAGLSVSNKVLECVVARFSFRTRFTTDAFLLAAARLVLAHERHRRLDARLKANPLSLEEMILMTVYS